MRSQEWYFDVLCSSLESYVHSTLHGTGTGNKSYGFSTLYKFVSKQQKHLEAKGKRMSRIRNEQMKEEVKSQANRSKWIGEKKQDEINETNETTHCYAEKKVRSAGTANL